MAAALGALAWGLMAAQASACPPPPPFPPPPAPAVGMSAADIEAQQKAWSEAHQSLRDLQDADWRLQYQRMLFSEAESILIARIDRVEAREKLPEDQAYLQEMPRVVLKPVEWVKGSGSAAELPLVYTGLTSCGPMPGFEAMWGKPGGVYVVYLKTGAALAQANVMHVIAVNNIRDADTLAALTKQR